MVCNQQDKQVSASLENHDEAITSCPEIIRPTSFARSLTCLSFLHPTLTKQDLIVNRKYNKHKERTKEEKNICLFEIYIGVGLQEIYLAEEGLLQDETSNLCWVLKVLLPSLFGCTRGKQKLTAV